MAGSLTKFGKIIRRKTDLFGKWEMRRKPFAKGVYKKAYVKGTDFPAGVLFKHKGEIVLRGKSEYSKKTPVMRFWEMRIIHELFPHNVPKIKAAESLRDGQYLLHFDYFPPNPELEEFMENMIRGDSWFAAIKRHGKKVRQDKKVSSIDAEMKRMGIRPSIGLDPRNDKLPINGGNVTNVSIANPEKPVFFEPKIQDVELLRGGIGELPQKKRAKVLRMLDRYDTLKEELRANAN